ncbi:phosphoglycerate dehydrogenase [Candidatus Methylacidithermus pantelleriae]|uniref:D-3-phosphoglycerate dehydrogenase n=1 Tax=Candidatus Methylacidithermus pantelleriae TaxID=2744239 RepID=A0A8J2FP48_9BACT|nr:phosphoglycerate dehydrogenase [Candidatus Methylacidithermus pantelleriae]CAF0696170.1 D-3-phosphoglycerate dehydrogenase [Candidatus Methylacidithermus pantelleriae]
MEKIFRVLVADAISEKGLERLRAAGSFDLEIRLGLSEEELEAIVGNFDALLIRSQTKVTRRVLESSGRLRVIGRAGVGTDNVDVEAATEKGIVVMNTPGGNTIATAEHAFCLILALARNVARADAWIRQGRWDRKALEGVELCNKTLGIIGLGRIGSEVARRAASFGMRVLGYDPYLSLSRARSMDVELCHNLAELLAEADFITLHTPLTEETTGIINRKTLQLCKQGVRIVNCARGGLIVEKDLIEALQEGRVAGAALDVFETEPLPPDSPLCQLPQVLLTPHLGASTREAQESVGIEIAEAVSDYLLHGTIRNAVNLPSMDRKIATLLQPYLRLAERLGSFMNRWAAPRLEELRITYSGRINQYDTTPISRTLLKAVLRKAGGKEVNEVNAPYLARALGISVTESKRSEVEEFADLVSVEAYANSKRWQAAATLYGSRPRLVQLNDNALEAPLEGILLVLENRDRPGIVGRIGTLLGEHKVNIAAMSLARPEPGGDAVSVLNLDHEPPVEVLRTIAEVPDVRAVTLIHL